MAPWMTWTTSHSLPLETSSWVCIAYPHYITYSIDFLQNEKNTMYFEQFESIKLFILWLCSTCNIVPFFSGKYRCMCRTTLSTSVYCWLIRMLPCRIDIQFHIPPDFWSGKFRVDLFYLIRTVFLQLLLTIIPFKCAFQASLWEL